MASRIKHELRARSNALHAFNILREVLTEISWGSEPDEENFSFHVDFGPPHIPVSDALVAIAVPAERFVIHVNFGPEVSSERRDEVARFITYVNWHIPIGDFEMNYQQGRVRFKSSLDFSNTELSEAMVRNTILAAMNAVEAFADTLMDVMVKGKDAKQAFEEVHARLRGKHVM
jgi:hypothetical protein